MIKGVYKMPKTPIYLIIETDCEGKYCSSIPTDNKSVAEEMISMYKASKQGFLHNYKLEEHYL